jgi:hypothetical protein
MGFFKDIWKGLKSGVKSIGKGIKKAFNTVGKFVNKLGVVGQIGLMFILPGIGGMLGQALGTGIKALAGSSNAFLAGVGKVLGTAGKFANTAGNAFKSVTDGVMNFAKEVSQGFVNQTAGKLGMNPVFTTGPSSVTEGLGNWMTGVKDDVLNITSPFAEASNVVSDGIVSRYDKQWQDRIGEMSTIKPEGSSFRVVPDAATPTIDFDPFGMDSPISIEGGGSDVASQLAEAEQSTFGQFASNVFENTKQAAIDAPSNLIDTAGRQLSAGLTDGALGAVGLGPKPAELTQITNVIPEFNSAPVSLAETQNGFNFGATMNNRLQYFAGQNQGQQDFGMGSFNKFAPRVT